MTQKNESLIEFLTRREAEIKDARAQLLLELKQIKAARAAIQSPEGERYGSGSGGIAGESKPTIKNMVVTVLGEANEPKTTDEIIELIERQFETVIVRSSISPQLSRLRHQDGVLGYNQETSKWVLLDKSHTTPNSSPSKSHGEDDETQTHGGGNLWE